MALTDALKRKIGPLPLWGWGLVGAAGVGVSVYLRRRQAGTTGVGPTGAGTSGDTFASGLGESAVPFDVTGRAPDELSTPATSAFDSFLPISEPFFVSAPFPQLDLVTTPSEVAQPITTLPPLPAPGTPKAGCVAPHVRPDAHRYAPRECPNDWHLVRNPALPCFGWCVPNVG